MADDLGYAELGSYGQQRIQTPCIDRLATGGMRFTQFYSGSAVCAPARCNLLTGRHGGNAYIWETEINRLYRSIKLLEIGAGTTEVRKLIIAEELLKS